MILCESIIDALSFWVNGFRNVTASYGISGFTDEMLERFIEKQVRRVYIAYDRDEAGESAAQKLSKTLNSEGIETLRIRFPHNMDANDYIRSVKPAAKSLQVLINGAAWSGEKINREKQPEPLPLAAPVAAEPGQQNESSNKEKINVPYTIKGEDVVISLGDRHYRIRGLSKNLSYDVLKVNIRIMSKEKYYIDTLDLYNARHRTALINAAAEELECNSDIIKRDLGRVLIKLEELQEENINETL